MRLWRDTIKVFMRSKILFFSMVILYFYSIHFTMTYFRYPLEGSIVTAQLQQALKLSFYLFLVVLFLSYEYYLKFRHHGMEEVLAAVKYGKKKKTLWCAFFTMTLWIGILTVTLCICVIIAYSWYGIHDPHGEYRCHIIQNMMVNVFLIMELGNLMGLFLSKIKKRIIAYAIMILVVYLVSPYPERIADAQCVAGNYTRSIYPIIECFNIMPLTNTGFDTIAGYGEPLEVPRISLILFWIACFCLLICLSEKCKKWKITFCSIAAIILFYGYAAPASVVNMNGNPDHTMAHDQYYYEASSETKTKNKKANYHITSYNMDLKIGRLLKAKVTMEVSKSLKQYPMTLYHGYRINRICDQSGNDLDYVQKGDYITINNQWGKEIKKISVEYKGYSAAYYSNHQGIYLPGDFAYYLREGYIPLHDDEQMAMSSCFVRKDTKFKVKLDYGKKVYTNLPETKGVYEGKCDGFTIFSGFYKEKKFGNGNRLIYNYLYGECYLDGGIDEICKSDEKSLEEIHKQGVTIFVAPNVNQMRNRDIGDRQILLRNSPWF